MRRFAYIILATALITMTAFVAHSQESARKALSFRLENNPSGRTEQAVAFPKKAQRLSNEAGRIKVIADVPDSVLTAFQLAADSWSAKIKNRVPVYIQVVDEVIDPSLPMLVNAFYKEENMLPTALDSQHRTLPNGSLDSPDAMIFWNGDMDWNCSFSNQSNNSGLNVYSYGLRAIAIALGFGASVTQYDGDEAIVFQETKPTVFDDLVFAGETKLSSLESGSSTLAGFVVKPNVYAFKESSDFKLYSPPSYELGKSLVYLDKRASIMHYEFGQADKNFNIDTATITLLNQLGWNLREPAKAKIACDNIGDDGIGSAYESHSFTLVSDDEIEAYSWKLTLWDKNGQEKIVAQGNDATFTNGALTDIGTYARNASGDVDATVSCSYRVDNEWFGAVPFKLSLETKPQIIAISEPEIIVKDNSPIFYARFTVEYIGAEMITIIMEEDGDVNLRYFYVEEPIIAHVVTRNMNSHYYNWVDIKVANKYGSATETLEFEPVESRGASIDAIVADGSLNKVYNAQGIYIGEYTTEDLQGLSGGIYFIGNTNGSSTKKILIR